MDSAAPSTAVATPPVDAVAGYIDERTVTTEDDGVVTTATSRTATVTVRAGDDMTESEALAYALSRVRWYDRHRKLARAGAVGHDLLLLVTGAATTLAAALNADARITSGLAATSFVLAGMTKVFRWRENWTSRSLAWSQLSSAVNRFRFLPPDKRDNAAIERLVSHVDRVIAAETRNSANAAHSQEAEEEQ